MRSRLPKALADKVKVEQLAAQASQKTHGQARVCRAHRGRSLHTSRHLGLSPTSSPCFSCKTYKTAVMQSPKDITASTTVRVLHSIAFIPSQDAPTTASTTYGAPLDTGRQRTPTPPPLHRTTSMASSSSSPRPHDASRTRSLPPTQDRRGRFIRGMDRRHGRVHHRLPR